MFYLLFHIVRGDEWECFRKTKQEVREKELERKVEAFRKKQTKKERVKSIQLTRAIYVESLTLHAPTRETIIFDQKQRSRELKEELEATFSFIRKTITSTTTP